MSLAFYWIMAAVTWILLVILVYRVESATGSPTKIGFLRVTITAVFWPFLLPIPLVYLLWFWKKKGGERKDVSDSAH